MRPLRILWVKVGGLWPPTTGGRLRTLHMIAELSQRHRVSLLTTRLPADDPASLRARLPACERIEALNETVQFHAREALRLIEEMAKPKAPKPKGTTP